MIQGAKIVTFLVICILFQCQVCAFMPFFRRYSPISSNKMKFSSTKLCAVKSHKVTIQHLGEEKDLIVPENVSILTAALDAGIELPHDCKLGVCLTCPSKVVKGVVDQTEGTLDDSVTSNGYALTCITYPRSDCIIRSIDEDELVSAQFSRDS